MSPYTIDTSSIENDQLKKRGVAKPILDRIAIADANQGRGGKGVVFSLMIHQEIT